ncbi:hypothetical protein NMG60_11019843 [Bertholletia excelsa]
MSPTISAASKINASPRKKVLAERNESVRSSISFSEGKSLASDITDDADSQLEIGLNGGKNQGSKDVDITNLDDKEAVLELPLVSKPSSKDGSFNSEVPLNPKKASESLHDMKLQESKPASSIISPNIAPLDADPSVPPYDPKTNFLSPRPRFLHYKPNPRIEAYLHKEITKEGKRLEESFLTESFSDTEVTEETESESSQKESEDASSSAEVVNEEVEASVYEPMSDEPTTTESIEGREVRKRQFFTRSKLIAFILVVVVTCASVPTTDSPRFDLSIYKGLNFANYYDSSQISGFAKASFEGFPGKIKQWSCKSLRYLSELIPNLDEVDKLGPLQFTNLTALLDNPFVVDGKEESIEEIQEEDELFDVQKEVLEENLETGDTDTEAENNGEEGALDGEDIEESALLVLESEVIEPDNSEAGVLEVRPEEKVESNSEMDEADVVQALEGEIIEESASLMLESELVEPDNSETGVPETRPEEGVEPSFKMVETDEIQAEKGLVSGAKSGSNPESFPELSAPFEDSQSFKMVETDEIQAEKGLVSGAKSGSNPESFPELSAPFEDSQSSKAQVIPLNFPGNKFSDDYIPAVSLLALALLAALVFLYLKQRRVGAQIPAVVEDPLLAKKELVSASTENMNHQEEDEIGESCPSEMSSFQTSSSYSKRGLNEAQSQERRQKRVSKRESLASSSEYSMGSPSYGSFTTYEKIPNKHGAGDEEIITPVRRSSRIKNQAVADSQ